ncbi:hypothetical protein [Pandoraea soli]
MPPQLPIALALSSVYAIPRAKRDEDVPSTARSEWRDMTARPRSPSCSPSLATSVALPSIETLGESIREGFAAIRREWDAATQTVSPEAVRDTLSGDCDAIVRLAEVVSAHRATDLLGVDQLIETFEKAIRKIGSAHDIALGSYRSVDAQRRVTDVGTLSPKAKAAFDALSHLKSALDTMVLTLSAKRCLEEGRQALKGAMAPEAFEHARAELSDALEVTAELVSKTEPLIHHYLTQAHDAIPSEKRRWRTKIAILATLLIITVSLGVASALAPPLIPALAGLALGLKLATTGTGIITALNGMFNVFGYARNRGWSRLSDEIAAVNNLNNAINRGFEARNSLLRSNETAAIQMQLGILNLEVAAARHKHRSIDNKLSELSGIVSDNFTATEHTRL